MVRWLVPSIAVLAALVVGVWIIGCRPQQADTQATVA